jgi:hypothetical protein
MTNLLQCQTHFSCFWSIFFRPQQIASKKRQPIWTPLFYLINNVHNLKAEKLVEFRLQSSLFFIKAFVLQIELHEPAHYAIHLHDEQPLP